MFTLTSFASRKFFQVSTECSVLLSRVLLRKNHVAVQDAEEIRVPLPYGFIAGKRWGNMNGYPILCLHGLADNCDSFLPIGPSLSPEHQYIALDAMGHGLTSHVPTGTALNPWDFVMHIRRTVENLKITNFSILGHSMGGSTGFQYASIYPDTVDKLLSLDMVKPLVLPLPYHKQKVHDAIEMFLDTEKKLADTKSQKGLPVEMLIARYVTAMKGTIKPESVQAMIKRGTKAAADGKGSVFSYDLRMMMPCIMRFSLDHQREIIKSLKCHVKIIKAKQGILYDSLEVLEEFKGYYRQQCRSYEYVEVEGTHHVHMDHPDRVVHIINDYFSDLSA